MSIEYVALLGPDTYETWVTPEGVETKVGVVVVAGPTGSFRGSEQETEGAKGAAKAWKALGLRYVVFEHSDEVFDCQGQAVLRSGIAYTCGWRECHPKVGRLAVPASRDMVFA